MYKRSLSLLALATCVAAGGCGGLDRALRDAAKGERSAVATARLTADAWSRGQVSARFAHLAFVAARARLEKDRQRLAQDEADASREETRAMLVRLQELSARLAQVADAASRDDLAGAQALVREIQGPPSS
jgi:hypothetical protein